MFVKSSASRQKGLSTNYLHTQLAFALKLAIYSVTVYNKFYVNYSLTGLPSFTYSVTVCYWMMYNTCLSSLAETVCCVWPGSPPGDDQDNEFCTEGFPCRTSSPCQTLHSGRPGEFRESAYVCRFDIEMVVWFTIKFISITKVISAPI